MRKLIVFLFFPFLSFSQTAIDKAEVFLMQKEFMQAEQILIPVVKKQPNNLKAIELLGDAFAYQEKWESAVVKYKSLTHKKPIEANYHYKYGGALGMQALQVNKLKALTLIGDIEEAFLTAAKLDANHINTRWALVELYVQLPGIVGGSVSSSLEYAEELEALSKVDGYLAKGYVYEYDDEPQLAETYYKKAITVGGSLTCFEKLTNFYKKANQPEKAIQNLESSNDKHKRNALHYQIGKVAAEYNIQLEKGEQCLKVYIQNYSPEDGVPKAWAYYRLAQIYKYQKKKEKALTYIDLAITELPSIKVFKTERDLVWRM